MLGEHLGNKMKCGEVLGSSELFFGMYAIMNDWDT